MTSKERCILFESRFINPYFKSKLLAIGAMDMLLEALSDVDLNGLEARNVFFCCSFAPSSVIDLANVPVSDIVNLIDFEDEYLKHLIPEEVVAIVLHEIGHVLNPGGDLETREFKADDFAIERNYIEGLRTSLTRYIREYSRKFDNEINRRRLQRINEKIAELPEDTY